LDLHVPSVNLTKFKKEFIIQVLHYLTELKKFLIRNSFYSVEQYIDRDATYDIGVLLNSILIEMLYMILVFC